jgi:hypothetical protein
MAEMETWVVEIHPISRLIGVDQNKVLALFLVTK